MSRCSVQRWTSFWLGIDGISTARKVAPEPDEAIEEVGPLEDVPDDELDTEHDEEAESPAHA